MEYRMVDLLQCPCGGTGFVVKSAATKKVLSSDRKPEGSSHLSRNKV